MDDGGIVIFNLTREGTGVTVDGQHQLAALIVQQFRQVIEARSPDKARPVTLVLDEFGDYTSADFARVLTTARKFNVRCVFAHQSLSQLLLKDQDRTLVDTVIAVPNKLIFGGLPLDQSELLAKQVYLALLNPDLVKYQPVNVTWDPVLTKVRMGGRAESLSQGRSEGEARTSSVSAQTDEGLSYTTKDEPAAWSQGSGAGDSSGETYQWSFTSQHGWTESEHEAWVTFYTKRLQDGTPVYRSIEEQVFKYAQELHLNPPSTCVLTTTDSLPQKCRIPSIKKPSLAPQERETFMRLVNDKTFCFKPEEADRALAEREERLLIESKPRIVSSKELKTRRAPKKPPAQEP
jgi:hypothetical protein